MDNRFNDIVNVLAAGHPSEAKYVRSMLRAGRITGSAYVDYNNQNQECGCLLGTIAIKRVGAMAADANDIYTTLGIRQTRSGDLRPAEKVFVGLGLGDTPEDNDQAAEIDNFLTEVLLSNPDVYGVRPGR